MRWSASIAVFVSGILLYSVAVHVGGYLAAITVPRTYFEFFGTDKALALVVEEAFVYALPIFLLAATWGYASIRPLRDVRRKATLWCLAGVVVGWLGWTINDLANFLTDPVSNQYSLATLALIMIVPPVWGVLNIAAAPGGVMFAGWLAGRSNPGFQRMAMPPLN